MGVLWYSQKGNSQEIFKISITKLLKLTARSNELTDCGLVTPYGDQDLGQNWHT